MQGGGTSLEVVEVGHVRLLRSVSKMKAARTLQWFDSQLVSKAVKTLWKPGRNIVAVQFYSRI